MKVTRTYQMAESVLANMSHEEITRLLDEMDRADKVHSHQPDDKMIRFWHIHASRWRHRRLARFFRER
jgi:hypothetical protein